MKKTCTLLEDFLGGQLSKRTLTCIYGPPASGKTNLALIAAAKTASEDKVIYVDAEGGFSTERMKQICGVDVDIVLGNILVLEPHDLDEQKVAIYKLDELVKKTNAKLVIIDSIGVLYRLKEKRDTKELGRMIAQLMKTARKNNIPVLLTNQVYSDIESGEITPVGGSLIKYWCKIIIELLIDENGRKAILKKHKHIKEGKTMNYVIIDEGIKTTAGEYYANQQTQDSR